MKRVVVSLGESGRRSDAASVRPHFESLFFENLRYLQHYVERHHKGSDVDDVVSETFMVAWRRLDDLPVGAERPWLVGIARNLIRNSARSAQRRSGLIESLVAGRPRTSNRLGHDRFLSEDYERLQVAFSRLSACDQEVLAIAAWEGWSGADLALALGITPGQAADRLHRARKRLRAYFTFGADE